MTAATPPGCVGARDFGALVLQLRHSLPRPLVFSAGVFDLLHAGHVACLEWARAQGASLVVGVNSDNSARRLRKGPGRPLHTAADRARVVAALSAVSSVVVFDEDKPLALMCALRPDVYVKGAEHTSSRQAESALMAEWGGQTRLFPRVDSVSTTGLIGRIERLHRPLRSGLAPAVQVQPH